MFNADDAAPAAVQVAVNGSTITWGNSPSNDVIGYYVYNGDTKIGTIGDSSSNCFTIGSGSYSVKAVDITGKLSGLSNAVSIENGRQ